MKSADAFYADFGGKCAKFCAMDFNMVKMCLMQLLLVHKSIQVADVKYF